MTNNQNVKALISASSDTLSGVLAALADHKISFVEILSLVAPLTEISQVDFKAAVAEWKGADAESRAGVIAFAHENIDLKDDAIEGKVEAALDMLISAGGLFTYNVAA